MTVHASVRSISALLLLSVSFLGLPAGAPAPIVARRKTARTLDLPHRYIASSEMAGRAIFELERVELAPDPFTWQSFTASGRRR